MNIRIEKAIYYPAILPEHAGNPFIEALPPKRSDAEIFNEFTNYPDQSVEIRKHPNPLVRNEYTVRIRELRQPLPLYLDIFRAIEIALKNGYSTRNPFSPTTTQMLHYPSDAMPKTTPITGRFNPKGEGMTLIGESGVGKTSLLEQVLVYFPNVIVHDKYNDKSIFPKKQIVWIKVDCPHKASVRDLCEEILLVLDEATGCEETTPERTIGKLTRQIEQIIKSNFLGLLVIDEMQRLNMKRTGGASRLLDFLHTLVNKLGIPIFFCANPPFDEMLAKTLKAARRAESAGYFEMRPLEYRSEEWAAFIEELWELHWTNVSTPLTEELEQKMYALSVGNVDLAQRIYRVAQNLVIGTDDETITTAVLQQAADTASKLSGMTEEVQTSRREIALPRRNKASGQKTPSPPTKSPTAISSTSKAIPDVTRPQHPEFRTVIINAMESLDILDSIKVPDLLRVAAIEEDVPAFLEQHDLYLSEPLKMLK